MSWTAWEVFSFLAVAFGVIGVVSLLMTCLIYWLELEP